MHRFTAALAAVALTAVAAPATAASTITWNFGGPAGTTNVASTARTQDGVTLTATARRFSVPAGATDLSGLNNLSETNDNGGAMRIQQTQPGIGVNGGGSASQVDTNQTWRESILVTSSAAFRLTGLKLSMIDVNDTLQIYGVGAGGALTSLGFTGLIRSGLDGEASFVNSGANGGTTTLTFLDHLGMHDGYLFTTFKRGDQTFNGVTGQGYRIDAITGGVPEPATWATMIGGFGLAGAAMRRRKAAAAAV